MAKRNDPKEHVLHNFQELKFVDNISCPIRGSLRLYRFHPFTKYMASKLVCSVPTSQMNPEQQESLLRQYKDRIKIKQPHVMYSIECESQKIMKSTQHGTLELFQIFVYFEYGQLNLEEMVFKRAQKKYLMPEIEVWCLIKGVIQAMHFFQTHQIQHGMLQLKSIYFDEEYLLYRVYDQELIAGRWGNWLKYQQTKDPDLFVLLAPETRPFFNQNAQLLDQAQINPFKADVYSFGIPFVGSLNSTQQIYQISYKNVSWQMHQKEWIGLN
ncbi:hypothetical protein pb186bvf_007691 [Paramecium bursaria]